MSNKLREALENFANFSIAGCDSRNDALQKLQDLIGEAKAALSDKEDGWIDVNDRLPDNTDNVLIYANKIGEQIEVAFYNDVDKEWHGLNDFWLQHITHWQPLPQPPSQEIK